MPSVSHKCFSQVRFEDSSIIEEFAYVYMLACVDVVCNFSYIDIYFGNFPADKIVLNIGCCYIDEDSGIRRSQLVNWYLENIENEIDSEAELLERKTIVEKVIYRLVHHVCAYFMCTPFFCCVILHF